MVATESELSAIADVKQMFQRAQRARSNRLSMWNRAYRMVHNKGWADSRPVWMPSPQASEVMPIIASLVGWMTDQRTVLELSPAAEPHSPYSDMVSQLAKDLEQVLHSLWVTKSFDLSVEQVLWDAMLYGLGVFKVVWDPGEDDGQGNPVLRRIDPWAFYPDPSATSLDDAGYLIEARKMSTTELERRFPGAGELVKGGGFEGSVDQRDELYASGTNPMANPGGYPTGTPPRYGLPGQGREHRGRGFVDAVMVYECWIRENELWMDDDENEYNADRWRVVVVAGNNVLMEEWADDLWTHGRHPYVRYVIQDLGEFYGFSLVDHLAPCQVAINRLLAALQSHAELVGNPIFLQDNRSGIPRTQITNRPGTRLSKNSGSEVGWLTPPEMSSSVQELVKFWIGEMERISGLSAIVRGMTPTGRNAEGVIDSIQESAFVRVRGALRNLERSLKMSGMLLANLVTENYNTARNVAIVGPQGEQDSLQLRARHFFVPGEDGSEPLKFSINVQAGASMPTSRQSREAKADRLFAMGAIDRQAVLEAHDYPNRQTVLQRVQEQIAAGTFQPPGARQRSGRNQ